MQFAKHQQTRTFWYDARRSRTTVAGFEDRCLKPLGHPSVVVTSNTYTLFNENKCERFWPIATGLPPERVAKRGSREKRQSAFVLSLERSDRSVDRRCSFAVIVAEQVAVGAERDVWLGVTKALADGHDVNAGNSVRDPRCQKSQVQGSRNPPSRGRNLARAGLTDSASRRLNELQVNSERLDEYVGLPRGYYSKVAGAKPIRRLGMTSFAPILNGLASSANSLKTKRRPNA